jgi:uridine phosphorylase
MREFVTHTGIFQGKRITVMSTGMGTDNIEIAMTELDALFNIDLKTRSARKTPKSFQMIRIGTSGAIREDIPPGSFLAAKYSIGLDIYNSLYDMPQDTTGNDISMALKEQLNLKHDPYCIKGSEKLLDKIAFDIPQGNTVTTPGFYAAQGRQLRIPVRDRTLLNKLVSFNHNGFKLSNMEMESSTIYGFARLMGHEALSINAVLANRVKSKFFKNKARPIDKIIELVLERI